MILEIAIGVAFGIILAVVILRYWRHLLSGALQVSAFLLFLGVVLFLGFYLWEKWPRFFIYGGAWLALVVLYGLPFFIYRRVCNAYPQFGALLKGEAPWDISSRLPLRLGVMSLFALAVAGTGIGALFGSVWLFEHTFTK